MVNSSVHPQALYWMCSNGHNFIAKVDSEVSCNCISKSLWNRTKVNNRLAKPNVVLAGAGGSKLSLLGFSEITCLIGKFTFTEEFAVIEGMVSDILLGIKWNTSSTFTPVVHEMEITTYQEANTTLLLKV